MQTWVHQLLDCNPPVRTIGIAGNKLDKAAERTVTREEGQRFADDLARTGVHAVYGECSALSGVGINEIFEKVCQQLMIASHDEQS